MTAQNHTLYQITISTISLRLLSSFYSTESYEKKKFQKMYKNYSYYIQI